MVTALTNATPTPESLQASFLALLPRIENRARIYFRSIKCAVQKADCIAEAVAIAWKWFCRLVKRGKDASQFVGALASLAARAVKCGRRACGQEKANDVMSWVAQRRHGFMVGSFPSTCRSHDTLGTPNGQRLLDTMEERLHDNTMTPPPEQAAFRIDFPAWLRTLSARERRIIQAMAWNERTLDLSRQFALSPARISQLRRQFKDDWQRFVGNLDTLGNVYEHTPQRSGPDAWIGSSVTSFGIAGNGDVIMLNTLGNVYEHTPQGSGPDAWIGSSVVCFAIAGNGDVIALNTPNDLYLITPGTGVFVLIARNVKSFLIASDGRLFITHQAPPAVSHSNPYSFGFGGGNHNGVGGDGGPAV